MTDQSLPETRRKRGRPRTGKREDVLRAASTLFYERGYAATSMDDIGEAVGISGPAVYRHFRSKDEILLAAIQEAADRSESDIGQIHEEGGTPKTMLKKLIDRQAEQGIEVTPLIGLALREAFSLPRDVLAVNQRRNRINREEWVHLVSQVQTGWSDAEVRAVVVGAKQMLYAVITADVGLTDAQKQKLATSLMYRILLDAPSKSGSAKA